MASPLLSKMNADEMSARMNGLRWLSRISVFGVVHFQNDCPCGLSLLRLDFWADLQIKRLLSKEFPSLRIGLFDPM